MGHSYQDLIDAVYLDFNKIPITELGYSFCDQMILNIEANEKRTRARRKSDLASFHLGVRAIVSALLLRHCQKPWAFCYRSVSKKSFSDSVIKGDTFNNLIAQLEANGFLEVAAGSNQRLPFTDGFGAGLATRFRATQNLIDAWLHFDAKLENIVHHFGSRPDLDNIQLKEGSKRIRNIKTNGRRMKFHETDKTKAVRLQLRTINEYLLEQSFNGTVFLGLRRIFNEGDREDFNWNMGGRLYANGVDNFQNLKKVDRKKITINGQVTIELDINASFLRILHGIHKFPINKPDDVYAIPGIDRSLAKVWIAATLGHTSFHRAWPTRAIEELVKNGFSRFKIPSYPSLKPIILEHFPVLETWSNGEIRWSHLMHEEAEAMIQTIEALRQQNIPALPVHDSLIVPLSYGHIAKQTIKTTFEERFGVPFVINGI